MPYYLGGEIAERESLLLNTPQSLAASLASVVRTGPEVISIDPVERLGVRREYLTHQRARKFALASCLTVVRSHLPDLSSQRAGNIPLGVLC